LWDQEFPDILAAIEENKDTLSTSFEIVTESLEQKDGKIYPKSFVFAGTCILDKDKAAYPMQKISAVGNKQEGHSSEITNENSFWKIQELISKELGEDQYLVESYPSNIVYFSYKDNKYYKASYEIASDKVSIGKPTEVRSTWVKAAKWSDKYINDLPDSAFAVAVNKGTKKTLRILPHHNSSVKSATDNDSVDIPHLRKALASLSQSGMNVSQMKRAKTHLFAHAKALDIKSSHDDEITPDSRQLWDVKDRKNKLTEKGGVSNMIKIEELPEEFQDEVRELIKHEVSQSVEAAKAEHTAEVEKIKAEAAAKVAETEKTGTEKMVDLEKKVSELNGRIEAQSKAETAFEKIRTNYPEAKHKEIKDILVKAELKTATTDELLKLSTEASAQRTLNMGGGSGVDRNEIAKKYNFAVKPSN